MKPKVFITRQLPQVGLERIETVCAMNVWPEQLPPTREILLQQVRGVEGILSLLTDRIDGEVMDAAGPQLKVISNYAVGYDNIDIAAARERGIAVGNTPGVLTEATADLAFALLMAAARRLAEGAAYIRAGKWKTWEPTTLLGADITGATLGIIGLGRIGKAVAKRAAGFEMRVLAHSPSATAADAASVGATLVSLDELLSQSDFVSLHVPLNDKTRHLINRDTLRKMKPTAILINTARGPVVDQNALYEALTQGTIAAAALDVTDPEPLPADHPLLDLPNVLVVPHIGSATVKTRERMAIMAADNLIAGVQGRPLPHAVTSG
ncbi:MAG: D-glycerate dehydrogenase [Chloroflexota bacterium]|nr:MAG: D-glycerate dehydrogenase [Chloroflexota bacterium]